VFLKSLGTVDKSQPLTGIDGVVLKIFAQQSPDCDPEIRAGFTGDATCIAVGIKKIFAILSIALNRDLHCYSFESNDTAKGYA